MRYFAYTIDPLHIGTGGYRLGRVDNTIIRDPGTNLPKIPGTSISGVCRNYAIYNLEGEEREKALKCAKRDEKNDKNNCGECIICKIFGFASGKQKKNQVGRVKFFDGQIIAFPVATMVGPVWVTTASILNELGIDVPAPPSDVLFGARELAQDSDRINLGWLYMKLDTSEAEKIKLPEEVLNTKIGKKISERLIIAPEWLFAEIVNSNLEVRTSVSIDFETGAADPGALFTYEAIPRATLFSFDVVIDEYRCNSDEGITKQKVEVVVKSGLKLFEPLGLGGMNTRGFGRIKVLNLD